MKKALRIGIVSIVCIGLLVGYYYYLSHRNDDKNIENKTEVTEVDKLIEKDFANKYPATPREVVKWYNRYITAFYGQEYTQAELEKMADNVRLLLDEELLGFNPRELYMQNLRADIEDYKNREKTIVQSSVCDSNEVTYGTVEGDECAYVLSYYFTKEGSTYGRTYQQFVLRKDAMGQWKIITFRVTEGGADVQ